jgi:hypothetical protein
MRLARALRPGMTGSAERAWSWAKGKGICRARRGKGPDIADGSWPRRPGERCSDDRRLGAARANRLKTRRRMTAYGRLGSSNRSVRRPLLGDKRKWAGSGVRLPKSRQLGNGRPEQARDLAPQCMASAA